MDYLKEDHCLFGKEVWVKDSVMIGIAVVGCTGKLGINIVKEALMSVCEKTGERVNISSVRGGNIFGEHVVIFANAKSEVVEFKHQVSSREAFADGAIEILTWLAERPNGMYHMDDFSNGTCHK